MDKQLDRRKRIYRKRRKKEEKTKAGASEKNKSKKEKADIIPNYTSNLIAPNQRLTTNSGLFCHGKASNTVIRKKGRISKDVEAQVNADIGRILNISKNCESRAFHETSQESGDNISSQDDHISNDIFFSPKYNKAGVTCSKADKANETSLKKFKSDKVNESCSNHPKTTNEILTNDASKLQDGMSSRRGKSSRASLGLERRCTPEVDTHNDNEINSRKIDEKFSIKINSPETLDAEEVLKRREIITDLNHFLTGKNYSLFPNEDHYEEALLQLREFKNNWTVEPQDARSPKTDNVSNEPEEIPITVYDSLPVFNAEEPKGNASQLSSYHSISTRKSSVHQLFQDVVPDGFVFAPCVSLSTPKRDAPKILKEIFGSSDLMARERIADSSENDCSTNTIEMLGLEANSQLVLSDSYDLLDDATEDRSSRKLKSSQNSRVDAPSWRIKEKNNKRPWSQDSSSSSPEFKFTRHNMI